MIFLSNPVKWGAFCSSFLFLACCSTNKPTITDICDQCVTTNFQKQYTNTITDSIAFQAADSLGQINPNIPPKQIDGSMVLLTENNYLLFYRLSGQKKYYAISRVLPIPSIHESISDFLLTKDGELIITWNDNPEIFTRYKPENNSHVDYPLNKNAVGKITPFLNFGLAHYRNQFLFPIVSYEDALNQNSIFGIFDRNLNYLKGLGNYTTHDVDFYAPFYDSPITSNIAGNKVFISSSTSPGAVQFHLKTNTYDDAPRCFSKQVANLLKKTIPKNKLGDFKTLDEKYISDAYILKLYDTSKKLVRISKNKQPYYNAHSGMKNALLNASWNMEILDLKSNNGKILHFDTNKYLYTSAFILHEKLYILSNQQNKTYTYHAFF